MAVERKPLTFLTLPAEVRLLIYEHLVVDRAYPVLDIRSEEPEEYARRKRNGSLWRRTPYFIKAKPHRLQSAQTTYMLQPGPKIYAAVLGVNRQIHSEAAHLLYSSHIFDFATDVESAVPFFEDRTPTSLAAIRRINIAKRAWPYTREFDRYEWSGVCHYIATRLQLQSMGLGVFGGKVDESHCYEPRKFEKTDFQHIAQFDGMEWMGEVVMAIRGLQALDIKAIWEVCPKPCSNGLFFFADFSANIEKGFAEYLRENMVVGAA